MSEKRWSRRSHGPTVSTASWTTSVASSADSSMRAGCAGDGRRDRAAWAARPSCGQSSARNSPAELSCTPRRGRCMRFSGPRSPSSADRTWSRRSFRGSCAATSSGVKGSPSPTPAATSDRCEQRRKPNGNGWVINGEKLWTSFAHHATRCVVLARTGRPGSRGISAFLVDMDTPGVTASPLQTMADVDEFCSTSFVDVEVPAQRLLGELDGGWQVAQHILSCERGPIFWQRGAWLAHHLGLLARHRRRRRTRRGARRGLSTAVGVPGHIERTQHRIAWAICPVRKPPWTRS